MTFAGIAYKTDSQDRATLQAKVEPLTQVFRTAIADARALEVPASVRDVHERYLGRWHRTRPRRRKWSRRHRTAGTSI